MSLISNIGKETNTYMQKNKTKKQLKYKLPDVKREKKKYTCNIYGVSETMPFIWSASKTVWISVTMKLLFPGRIFLSPLNKRAPILGRTERLPCFFTIEAPLLSRKNASSRLRHKRSPLSATQCALSPYLVLPLTVCPVCELSWSQCSQLIKKKKAF